MTVEAAWTPGPWFPSFNGGWSVRHSGHGAEIPLASVSYPVDEQGSSCSAAASVRAAANARLIAAAPDLFAALETAAQLIKDNLGDQSSEDGWQTEEIRDGWVAAFDALAKATGAA